MNHEKLHDLVLNLTVFVAIAIVAYTDYVVVTISLGYLYLLPLSLSAVVHRRRTTLLLVAVCVLVHDWFGPFEHTGTMHVVRNVLTGVAFTVVVLLISSLVGQRRRLTEMVRQQRDEMAHEIQLAADVQRRLLPLAPPNSGCFDIYGNMYPAKTVGGDYFDYIETPDGRIGLAIADVSGKGMPAALLMPAVETALRVAAQSSLPIGQTIQVLNKTLFDVTDEGTFVTLFYAVFDPRTRQTEYCNAGHHPALLFRVEEDHPILLETGGTLLGMLPQAEYKTGKLQLVPGDVLALYTDGAIEAPNARGDEFSKDRLRATIRAHLDDRAEEIVRQIYADVMAFTGDSNLPDDLTAIVLKLCQNE